MGDILLLKEMLVHKLADKSQSLKHKAIPRLRFNLYIRTDSSSYSFKAFLPFETTKLDLQRHILSALGLSPVSLFVQRSKEITDETAFAEHKGKCVFEWSPVQLLVMPRDPKARISTIEYR